MNNHDPFEKRMQSQPPRPVPPAWRQEILGAARASASPPRPRDAARGVLPQLKSLLSNLFWPHPRAWAGLAAVWLLVLGLNFAASDPVPPEVSSHAAPLSPQMRELLQQQEQLLAELVGPVEKPEARRSKPAAPQPRSQRREQLLNA